MEPRVNFTLVGLFVLVLVAALGGAALWLGEGDYRKVYDRYYAYMGESVSGLSVNSPVKYRGVEVGLVKEIALNPDNPEEVRLTLDIARGTPLKEDTLAVLDSQGLTGLAIVNLTGGSRNSPPLAAKPDQEYPVIQSGPSLLYRLDTALSRLLTDQSLTKFLSNSTSLVQDARSVIDEENRAALKQTLADLAAVAHTLSARNDRVDRGVVSAAQSVENLVQVTKDMKEQLPILVARMDKVARSLDTMTTEAASATTAVGAVVNDTRPNIEQFSRHTLAETGLLVAELRQLTATLQRVARQLDQEPDSLIFGKHPAPRGPGE